MKRENPAANSLLKHALGCAITGPLILSALPAGAQGSIEEVVVIATPHLNGFSGSIDAAAGNHGRITVRGDVTRPRSDDPIFTPYGSSNQRDGYSGKLELDTAPNELDRWIVHGQLLWQPPERTKIRLIADAEGPDERCCGFANPAVAQEGSYSGYPYTPRRYDQTATYEF